eukprot:tig00001718_g9582.t1
MSCYMVFEQMCVTCERPRQPAPSPLPGPELHGVSELRLPLEDDDGALEDAFGGEDDGAAGGYAFVETWAVADRHARL